MAWTEKLISILVLVVSFLVFASPYLVYIKNETGVWHLSKKKSVSKMVGVEKMLNVPKNGHAKQRARSNSHSTPSHQTPNLSHPGRQSNSGLTSHEQAQDKDKEVVTKSNADTTRQAINNGINLRKHLGVMRYVARKYLSTIHPFLFVFFIMGVISWTRIKKERLFGFYIITIIIFYLFILYRLSITYYINYGDSYLYPTRRHLMSTVIPAVFFVGIGVYTTGTWMHGKFQSNSLIVGFKELLRSVWIVQLIILVVVVGALLPKTLKHQGVDKLGIKDVGQWIRENSDKPSPTILSASARNAYYAGGRHVRMGSVGDLLSRARAEKADYILITHKEYKAMEKKLQQSLNNKQIMLVYKHTDKASVNGRCIFLYKVLY